jgi:hypothetical protein
LQKFSDHPQLLLGALQACVGQAAGIELHAFVNNLDQLPDLQAIVAGKDSTIPKEIDLQYAVASALVGHAIRAKNSDEAQTVWGNILDYGESSPNGKWV